MQIMDSWIFGGAERVSFGLSDGNFQPFDSPSLTKEVTSPWGTSNSNLEHLAVGTGQSIVDNPMIIGSSFQGVQKAVFEGSVREFAENRVNDHLATSCSSLVSKTSVGEKEEGSKESSSIVDPDAHDSSFIDLNLGRLSEWRRFEESESPRDMQNLSVQASPALGKRTRLSSLSGKMPLCQVHGCNMDLSSFKDYYKRHRVCQNHSKTAKVIVNGIQQRFCQQCSRFHLLSEFDEGKRSCRKRLAGHNERRRKPQIVFQTIKSSLMLPYHGGNFLPGKTSFLCQNGISQHGNYESVNWSRFDSLANSLSSTQMPTSNFDEHPKSFAASCGTEKEISFTNGDVSVPGIMYNNYATRFSSGISMLDAGRAEKARVGVSNFGCARSLLSFQPICSSLSIPETQPAMFTSNNSMKAKPQSPFSFPDKSELALQVSSDFICSLGVDEPVCGQAGLLPCEIKAPHRMEAQTYINFRGSPFDGNDFALPSGQDDTANLLQLSSIIQDAESHGRSLQVKQELGHLPPFQWYR